MGSRPSAIAPPSASGSTMASASISSAALQLSPGASGSPRASSFAPGQRRNRGWTHSVRPAARSSSAAPGRPASGPAALSGRGAVPDGQRRTPPRVRASRGGRPAAPTRCSLCPYPPGAPAQHSFSAAVQPPLHGRLFYLNHLPKSTYLILSAPSEGSEIRFFCKKETRLRKAGFPACAAPAFFCKNVTFMLYFYHKSLFLVKMICTDFSK